MLRRQDIIISKVKQRGSKKYVKRMIKFGVELPKTVQEATEFDKNNGNALWAVSISNEMCYIQVGF